MGESLIEPSVGIAFAAYRSVDFGKARSSLTVGRRQAVAQSRHLRRIAQAADQLDSDRLMHLQVKPFSVEAHFSACPKQPEVLFIFRAGTPGQARKNPFLGITADPG